MEQFLREGDFETAAVIPQQAEIAADAFHRFGTGRHMDRLTIGDCFAYTLVREVSLPLLFRREQFQQTDLPAAPVTA